MYTQKKTKILKKWSSVHRGLVQILILAGEHDITKEEIMATETMDTKITEAIIKQILLG